MNKKFLSEHWDQTMLFCVAKTVYLEGHARVSGVIKLVVVPMGFNTVYQGEWTLTNSPYLSTHFSFL